MLEFRDRFILDYSLGKNLDVSLSRRCLNSVIDEVIAGTFVNLDFMPLHVRRSIFAQILSIRNVILGDRRRDDLPRCLDRGRFFDEFDRLHIGNAIDFRQSDQLLSTILSEIERPESSLGRTLVSLCLRVCLVDSSICAVIDSCRHERSSSNVVVSRLIAACRNLRELDLINCSISTRDCRCVQRPLTEQDYRHRYRLVNEIETTSNIDRAPLEKLILRCFSDPNFAQCFSAYRSLQHLELHRCQLSYPIWSSLLTAGHRTLTSLTMSKCVIDQWPVDASGLDLDVLRKLRIVATKWYDEKGRFLLSAKTLAGVQHGQVCVEERQLTPGQLETIADRLSSEIDLIYRIERDWHPTGLSSAQNLFGQRLVELRIISVRQFPETPTLKLVVDQLRSIRLLAVKCFGLRDQASSGDRFLRLFLSDVDRCATLRRLQILADLTAPTIRLVFGYCINLQYLLLCANDRNGRPEMPEITDEDLIAWTANGARPTDVHLCFGSKLTAVSANHLVHHCGNDLKASFLNSRREFVDKRIQRVNAVREVNSVGW